ncbi:hypothetical protein LCI18_001288 [Fusarium solani-melongenae]|uniref:Uncharacterized protein n=1 Tax=Fusarium solani subsp. cucurbitae TaxID=2747967 RepID=A0ACD3YN50_FUSSC|nr:hypothetical protein LCI18_001288 [Fusarium solani-melongenae]
MISSNTRASRSRYSSPAQSQNTKWNGVLDASKGATEGSRAFMQRWLEPTVQSKASFEDDGLMRYGVVENMAPLGSLPKPKKAAPETTSGVRRIILRPSGANAAKSTAEAIPSDPAADVDVDADADHDADADADADAAAAAAAAAARARAEASSPPPTTQPPTPPRRRSIVLKDAAAAADDEDDEDYDPNRTKRRQSGRASLGRRTRRSSGGRRSSIVVTKPAAKETREAREPKEKEANDVKETPKDKDIKDTIQASEPMAEHQDKEFIDKVVEAAVDEALKHYRYPTAWALRTLYDEKSGDPRFVAMIESVFNQTADEDTMRKFSKQMEEKKREGKKDNQGCYYFIPPTTNSRFTPHKPKAAPYGKLLHHRQEEHHQHDSDDEDEEEHHHRRAAKKAKTLHSSRSHSRSHSHSYSHPAPHSHPASGHATRHTPRKMSTDKQPRTPTSRKRGRRDSASSDSSLSSALSLSSPEASIGSPSPVRRGATAGRPGRGSGTGAGAGRGPGADSSDAPKPRPITTRRKSLAASNKTDKTKSKRSRSSPSASHSPTLPVISNASNSSAADAPTGATISVSAEASMPGRLAEAPILNNLLPPKIKAGKGAKGSSVPADEAGHDNDESFWDRRRDAQKFANSVTVRESSVRDGDGEDDEQVATPAKKTRRTRQSIAPPTTTRATRSASKRPHDEVESTVSPVAWPFQRESSSVAGSRAATPTLRPPKKQRTGLRVKSSPVKKRGGTAAGVPRAMGDGTATSVGAKDQISDNDEDCSACGAAGDVVCCDGCPRSFHFECVGMVPSDDLPDEWYCNECLFKRYPSRVSVHKGVFGPALNNLEKSIPRAFSLPKKLQTRFEGVKAGPDGEYEEVTAAKTTKRKNGYEEVPDFFRQRDDGQPVLCHGCQKAATDVRAIIPCSVCPRYWHIDCLDPPLAVPPVLKNWRCPLHSEEIIAEVRSLAPAHRFRKIKGAQTITPALSRGLKNNGQIEVDWNDETESEPESKPVNNSGWPDPDSFGRAYKLPAQGIVLDFIEQLRRQNAGYGPRQDEPRWLSYAPVPVKNSSHPVKGSDLQRSVDEMQVALTMTSLKDHKSESVDQLISALLDAADPNVLALMTKTDAGNIATGHLTDSDKLSLRVLLAQVDAMGSRIRHLLGEPDTTTMLDQEHEIPSILSPQDSAIAEPLDKVAVPPPVTEPTPPSTIDHAEGAMELD